MRIVEKLPTWKHITFKTPKINFLNWAKDGLKVLINEEEYEFKTKTELDALLLSLQPSVTLDK